MIKQSIGNINQFMMDDETRYKLKVSNYTIDGKKYRDLQDKAYERSQKLIELAKSLGVSPIVLPSNKEEMFRKAEFKMRYYKDKAKIDAIFDEARKVLTLQEIIDTLKEAQKIS